MFQLFWLYLLYNQSNKQMFKFFKRRKARKKGEAYRASLTKEFWNELQLTCYNNILYLRNFIRIKKMELDNIDKRKKGAMKEKVEYIDKLKERLAEEEFNRELYKDLAVC